MKMNPSKKMPIRHWLFLFFAAFWIGGCSFSLAADITPPPGAEQVAISRTQAAETIKDIYPLVPPDPSRGKEIYAEKCAPCHGSTGEGDGPRAAQLSNPVPPLASSELSRKTSPARWFSIVTLGNLERFMPPFPSLSDSQRWDVVAYALSLSAPQASIDEGRRLYEQQCARCHGEDGKGDGPEAVTLPKAPTNLSDLAFISSQSGVDLYTSISIGVPPAMPAFGEQLSEAQRWALVDYLHSFTFIVPAEQALQPPTPEAGTPPPGLTETPPPAEPVQLTPQSTVTIPAQEPSNMGAITGKVINGSGGDVPSDLEIRLQGYDDMQVVFTQTTTIKADRTFFFPDVEMVEGRVFIAMAEYGGTTYASDVNVVPPQATTLDMPITIYETTTDPSVIKVDRLHLFFDFLDESTIRVVELYIMSNTSKTTLIPSAPGQPSVRFKLPVGSSNLEFQDSVLGERYVATPDGFGDTYAIRPGSGNYQILFSFTMPYNRKLDLIQPVLLPIDAVVVLVPEGTLKVRSPMLKDDGKRDAEGAVYHLYSGESISPGQELQLTLSGQFGGSGFSLSAGSRTSLIFGLVIFGVAFIVAGIWFYRHIRLEELDEEEINAITKPETAEGVMDAIIALDDLFQAGGLPEEAYRQRRAELKERLKSLRDGS